jgi:hypothetical protein
MTIKSLKRYAWIGVLCSAACLSGHAQSTTQGAISGTVTDTSDAAIPNARVLIHSDATNGDVVLTTDGAGFFRAPQLAPAPATVTATIAGFSERRETGVIVEVNSVTALNPQLKTAMSRRPSRSRPRFRCRSLIRRRMAASFQQGN